MTEAEKAGDAIRMEHRRKYIAWLKRTGGYAYPVPAEPYTDEALGMTLRERIAISAMQGLVAHRGAERPKANALEAVRQADALIEALAESEVG